MTNNNRPQVLTPTHHAMLFALISRAVLHNSGEKEGGKLIRRAVRSYGNQRGRRMALRTRANGHRLTMANYLAYSEWSTNRGEQALQIVAKIPHARVHITRCPWHRAWTENGLIPYGRYYCLEIDTALVHGFNPKLKIDVNSTLAEGQPRCEFVFQDANLTLRNSLITAYRKMINPGKTCRMPWDYHTGHLYKTVGDVLYRELGSSGRGVVESALAEFAGFCGKDAARTIAAFKDTDFNKLP